MREYMRTISRHLDVPCTYCHDTANYNLDAKREFKIAKDHIKITQNLIDMGLDGVKTATKADCYLCHRGKKIPDSKEHFNPLVMEKSNYRDRKAASTVEIAPSIEDIEEIKK